MSEEELPTRDDRDCVNCRHRSPEHCPCVTVEEILLSEEEYARICAYVIKDEVIH